MRTWLHLPYLPLIFLAIPAMADAGSVPPRIDVFKTSAIDIVRIDWLRQQLPDSAINVYAVDSVERIEAVLGEDLPANPDVAEQTALRRLSRFGPHDRELLQVSANALMLAWQYQVRRYPAVVFDGRWVVYGVTDLQTAYALFREQREQGGL